VPLAHANNSQRRTLAASCTCPPRSHTSRSARSSIGSGVQSPAAMAWP